MGSGAKLGCPLTVRKLQAFRCFCFPSHPCGDTVPVTGGRCAQGLPR